MREYTWNDVKEITLTVIYMFFAIILCIALIKWCGELRRETGLETETRTIVVGCTPVNEYYEITVETENGEVYAYFSDNYMDNGTEIITTFHGDEIVDVRDTENGN